jgi:hypothetical protein
MVILVGVVYIIFMVFMLICIMVTAAIFVTLVSIGIMVI